MVTVTGKGGHTQGCGFTTGRVFTTRKTELLTAAPSKTRSWKFRCSETRHPQVPLKQQTRSQSRKDTENMESGLHLEPCSPTCRCVHLGISEGGFCLSRNRCESKVVPKSHGTPIKMIMSNLLAKRPPNLKTFDSLED